MSHLSEALGAVLALEGLSQSELAARVKTDRGTISRFRNGRLSPTRDMLARLVEAVSARKERQLRVLLAHLQDEAAACACVPTAEYVIAPASAKNAGGGVPVAMQESMATLLRAVAGGGHPELCVLLKSLGDMVAANEARVRKAREEGRKG